LWFARNATDKKPKKTTNPRALSKAVNNFIIGKDQNSIIMKGRRAGRPATLDQSDRQTGSLKWTTKTKATHAHTPALL
jgi:hypothetical protein